MADMVVCAVDESDAAGPVLDTAGGLAAACGTGLIAVHAVEAGEGAAEQAGAALLVVGSRGRGHLRSAVLGGVSRELASSGPCPVMVVSGPAATAAARPAP